MTKVKSRNKSPKSKVAYMRSSQGISIYAYFVSYLFFLITLLGLVIVNILGFSQSSGRVAQFADILKSPFSPIAHQALAQKLWSNKYRDLAKQELAIANNLALTQNTSSLVLGSSTELLQTNWEKQDQKLQNDFIYWSKIVKEKPDYRDAYITLAILAYQLDRTSDVRSFLNTVLKLDPNIKIDERLTN